MRSLTLSFLAAALAAKQDSRPDPALELEALTSQVDAEKKSLLETFPDDLGVGMKVPKDEVLALSRKFASRFLALAKKASGTSTGIAAILGAFNLSVGAKDPDACAGVRDELWPTYAESPLLTDVLESIGKLSAYVDAESTELWLERIVRESSREPVRELARKAIRETNWADLRRRQADQKQISERRAKSPQVGCVAPEIAAKDADGKDFKLSDYRGKVVVLDFWGFW